MKAVSYDHFGGPEVLALAELPEPLPGPGEVRVAVRAASINPVDGKIRRGELTFLSGRRFPKRVGGDFAGVISAVGEGVEDLRPGDEVFGTVTGIGGGAYADAVVTSASNVVKMPAGLSFEDAASIPVVAIAALAGLRDVGRVRAGTRLLINGASGGIGVFAVQIAKLLGAHVTATASGEGLALARQLGADRVVDYRKADVAAGQERYDVIFDLSGRLPFGRAKAVLERGGIFVNPTPTPAVIVGSVVANLFRSRKHRILMGKTRQEDLLWLAERVAAGQLRPVVARTFTLEQVQQAVRFAEGGGIRGKVVLTVGEPSAIEHRRSA